MLHIDLWMFCAQLYFGDGSNAPRSHLLVVLLSSRPHQHLPHYGFCWKRGMSNSNLYSRDSCEHIQRSTTSNTLHGNVLYKSLHFTRTIVYMLPTIKISPTVELSRKLL
ncbi:hypothetical protein SEVIR_4G025901v4 [Setaria viridis]